MKAYKSGITKDLFEVITSHISHTQKGWGSEDLIHNGNHCVKIMKLEPGFQVSMHWHAQKEETFILISGEMLIQTINKFGKSTITLLTNPLDSFTLDKNVPHTFYCPGGQEEETVFIEASTTDNPDDSYRVFPSGPCGKYSINR